MNKKFVKAYAKHRKITNEEAEQALFGLLDMISRMHDDLEFYGYEVPDIRQEAWLLAMQALSGGKVDPTRDPGPFLYRHTRNKLIALRRDQGGFEDIRKINGRANLTATELRKAISFAVCLGEWDDETMGVGRMQELRNWRATSKDADSTELYQYLLDNLAINTRTIFLKMMDDCPVKPWQRELVRREASDLIQKGGWGDA